ncbi:hypothetical protein, partial [Aeromonas caviae]|uniref:hypothetical protein n=1 Tax=Aeromonas caviae TaxID=648 RepID=UPI002B49CF36
TFQSAKLARVDQFSVGVDIYSVVCSPASISASPPPELALSDLYYHINVMISANDSHISTLIMTHFESPLVL